jgi:hypothetical protein
MACATSGASSDVLVGLVGQRHQLADRRGRIVALVGLAHAIERRHETRVLRGIGQGIGEAAIETLLDEAGAAAGDVDELADQVGVHARREVRQVEVEVVHAAEDLAA